MYSTVNKTFSEWLFDELKKRDMSQSDLARATGITKGGISNLLNQVRKPDVKTIGAIASAFTMDPEELFRIAGLLPPDRDSDPIIKEVSYLLSIFPESEKKQVLDYVRFMATKVEASKK